MLGSVFLAVTGAEALYADMGRFGRTAIRTTWLRLVFPALILNYFGQGALLLGNPGALDHPFYRLAPGWGLYPLVALATGVATVIASQAVISGAFSISWPGIGRLMIEAIGARDYPLAQGCVLVFALTYVIVNLLTDLSYSLIDPRVRLR